MKPTFKRCDHVICRRREQRQDMGCVRALFHEGNHCHTLPLGSCDPRWERVAPGGGCRSAHRHSFSPPTRDGRWWCECGASIIDGTALPPVTVRAR